MDASVYLAYDDIDGRLMSRKKWVEQKIQNNFAIQNRFLDRKSLADWKKTKKDQNSDKDRRGQQVCIKNRKRI